MVIPLVLIVAMGGYLVLRKKGDAPEKKPDVNTRLELAIAEIPKLRDEFQTVIRKVRDESEDAEAKAEAFRERAGTWLDEWEYIMQPYRDDKGRLLPEYQGYEKHRKEVSLLLLDFGKMTNF